VPRNADRHASGRPRRAVGGPAAGALAGWLALAAGASAGAAQAPAQQPPDPPTPRFRAQADVVVVEATVTDRRDVAVAGLAAGDFKAEIGGKAREIVSADYVDFGRAVPEAEPVADAEISTNAPADTGRQIVLIVDQSSLRSEAAGVIEAAKRWVLSLPRRDRVGLITYPATGPRIDPTTDHARVADIVTRLTSSGTAPRPFDRKNVSLWEAFRINEVDSFVRADVIARECRGEPLCADDIDMQAKTIAMDAQAQVQPVLRGLRQIVRSMGALPGPKHAVLLSSGWPIIERDAATELGWVAADAARANVTVHTFTGEAWALAASRSKPNPRSIQDQNLLLNSVEILSSLTGGRAVRLTGDYDETFRDLDKTLGGYYRLGVRLQPEDVDGKERRITLKVSRPGATLSAYRRVFVPTSPAEGEPPVDPERALRDALKGGPVLTRLGLRVTSYVLHGAAGASDLRIVAVGDVSRAAPGTATAVAALYELDGRPATAMENSVQVPAEGPGALSIELTAPPGHYVLRVAVRDAEGRIGSLERLVDARWRRTGPVETPGLVLFRSGEETAGIARPVFDRVTTNDQLIAQMALSADPGAAAPVTFELSRLGDASALLRRSARIAETTTGRTVAQDSLAAAVLPPGRYVMSAAVGSARPFTRSFVVAAAAAPATVTAGPAAPGVPAAFARPRFVAAPLLDPAVTRPALDRLADRSEQQARFAAGLEKLQGGDLDAAAAAFRAVQQAIPDFAPAHLYLGACFAAAAKDREATAAFQKALALEPSPLGQRLAVEGWLRAGAPAAAQALIAQARQRWPDDRAFARLEAHVAIAAGRVPEGLVLVAALPDADAPTLLLALSALYDAHRRGAPIRGAAADLEAMRQLRDRYAAAQGESLALVDLWMATAAGGKRS
jgi:VWFA-related protein